jgi:hypothetical protein
VFTKQAPLLAESMLAGGLPPVAASAIQNLLGQCRAPIVHRGPVTVDYTRQDMRLIGPFDAKYKYPDLNLPSPETLGKRRKKDPPPEESADPPPDQPLPPEHTTTIIYGDDPGNGGGEDQYFGGDYIRVDPRRREVHLIHDDRRRHCAFPALGGARNKIHSLKYTAQVAQNAGDDVYFGFTITEVPQETQWKLNVNGMQQVTYISDAAIVEPGPGSALPAMLVFTRKTAFVFDEQNAANVEIPLAPCSPPESP